MPSWRARLVQTVCDLLLRKLRDLQGGWREFFGGMGGSVRFLLVFLLLRSFMQQPPDQQRLAFVCVTRTALMRSLLLAEEKQGTLLAQFER